MGVIEIIRFEVAESGYGTSTLTGWKKFFQQNELLCDMPNEIQVQYIDELETMAFQVYVEMEKEGIEYINTNQSKFAEYSASEKQYYFHIKITLALTFRFLLKTNPPFITINNVTVKN